MRTGGYLGLTADDLSSCSYRGAGHAQPGATGAVEELSGHQPECTSCPWCCRAGIVKRKGSSVAGANGLGACGTPADSRAGAITLRLSWVA
jgi:hypothetical protein